MKKLLIVFVGVFFFSCTSDNTTHDVNTGGTVNTNENVQGETMQQNSDTSNQNTGTTSGQNSDTTSGQNTGTTSGQNTGTTSGQNNQ